MKFSKQQILFAITVFLAAIVIAVFIVWFMNTRAKPQYVAVRLASGELYFGKITWFLMPKLSNVWLIQVDQEGRITLDRFQNLLWRPKEPIRIFRDKIIFWTYLDPSSPVVQAIEGRAQTVPQQPLDQSPMLPPTATPNPR